MKNIILFLFVFLVPGILFARIGVGIGTGKIVVDQVLKPGLIYTLPSITVLNTGDEPSQYEVSTTYREHQVEQKPSSEWFRFKPSSFHLEPGKAQTVEIKLNLPVKDVRPGNYFVFLESHPVATSSVGGTSIGVAAASKLYFTVAPTNFFSGIYYRITSLFSLLMPWSFIVLLFVVLVVLIWFVKKYFSFNIGLSIKKK